MASIEVEVHFGKAEPQLLKVECSGHYPGNSHAKYKPNDKVEIQLHSELVHAGGVNYKEIFRPYSIHYYTSPTSFRTFNLEEDRIPFNHSPHPKAISDLKELIKCDYMPKFILEQIKERTIEEIAVTSPRVRARLLGEIEERTFQLGMLEE